MVKIPQDGQTVKRNRTSQRQRILNLLLQAFREHRELSLPEILALKIGLYNTRLKELRALGWQIRNRLETVGGVKHSFYRLESALPKEKQPVITAELPARSNLFGQSGPIPAATASTFAEFEMGVRR